MDVRSLVADALAYDDLVSLLTTRPRLAAQVPVDLLAQMYVQADALPPTWLEALRTVGRARGELLWTGATDTGEFSLETPDRAYHGVGTVNYGELAGAYTASFDGLVLKGMFYESKPVGMWTLEHDTSSTILSEEPYVDGLRQGTARYWFDLAAGVPAEGAQPTPVYVLDYVNDVPVRYRLLAPDGGVVRQGAVVDGAFV